MYFERTYQLETYVKTDTQITGKEPLNSDNKKT